MRNLSANNTVETIELIGGVCPSEVISVPNDGRNEHYVPFTTIFDMDIVEEGLVCSEPIPNWSYVYKRVGDSSVFGYCGIERK